VREPEVRKPGGSSPAGARRPPGSPFQRLRRTLELRQPRAFPVRSFVSPEYHGEGWYTLALSSICGRSQPCPRQDPWSEIPIVDAVDSVDTVGGLLMMRLVRVASCVVFGLLACAARGQAQAPAAGTQDASRFYVAFDAAATFGHKSSGSVGAEGGYV